MYIYIYRYIYIHTHTRTHIHKHSILTAAALSHENTTVINIGYEPEHQIVCDGGDSHLNIHIYTYI